MFSNNDNWIRIFDVPDVNKHKNGFTIYKVVSLLYPESCPDAVTKVTVWKRFNDFKKLHRELKVLHRKYNHKTKFPTLPTRTLFKRFDQGTISERKQSIQIFLDYIGSNQQLFTSNEFVKFLESSHTPADHLISNINNIRADLNLPEDPEVCTNLSMNSDDERTISDSDSVSTMSSLCPSLQTDSISDAFVGGILSSSIKKLNSSTSINSQTSSSKNSDSISISTVLDGVNTLLDDHIYPTPPNTPRPSATTEASYYDDNHHIIGMQQYIIDASVHIKLAMELESDKKYEEAFSAYKTAIDILLKYGKDDPNYERKEMIRYKTEKYLIKAEKIYNMYLAPEVKHLQLVPECLASAQEPTNAKRPLFDLYKYKVVKIIGSGMLVLHSELQQLFYIKVIHKTMQFLNDNLVLPENVPFMVKLHNHYNCENALFLVLEYCSGSTNLREYIRKQSMCNNKSTNGQKQILQQIQDLSDDNDSDDEQSFSDLVNEYISTSSCINRTNKKNAIIKQEKDEATSDDDDDDDSYEKIDVADLLPTTAVAGVNLMDMPLKPCNVEDLVSKSQQLLSSVDYTLTCSSIAESTVSKKKEYSKKKKVVVNNNDDKDLISDNAATNNQRNSITNVSYTMEDAADCNVADEADDDSALNSVLPEETVVKWAAQLLLALEKLHALGIVCRDLQMKNLMIDDENRDLVLTYMCNVKDILCDLYYKEMDHNLAPEVYSYQDLTPAADWWSYGAILYELLVGMPLSEIHTSGVSSFSHLKIPKYVTPEARSLLKQLLIYEPHNRLGSGLNGPENIKSHPFFNNVSWDSFVSS